MGRAFLLVVAEWLYLDWASRAPQLPKNFVHAEWITLHDNPNFRGFVDFLRAELDRVGPAQANLCRDFFCRPVGLELMRLVTRGRPAAKTQDVGYEVSRGTPVNWFTHGTRFLY
jgi:hypothetical protein